MSGSWPPVLFHEDFPRLVARALAHDPRAQNVVITIDVVGWRGAPDELQGARAANMGRRSDQP